ncbi:MAG: hypothetical protein V3T48_05650 [Vicinamibacterales bacterium]
MLPGTPEGLKRYVAFPGGHTLYSPLYRNRVIQETLPWLDAHIGPVS